MMTTKQTLEALPENHKIYLVGLKRNIAKSEADGNHGYAKEVKATARGYIRCLEDAGIIESFRTLWCWFTL